MIDSSIFLALGLIFVLAMLGVHVAVAFISASVIGLFLLFQSWDAALGLMEQTAFNGIRDYNLMVIPLFAVMGLLVSRSGAAGDLFSAANRAFRGLPARLAVASVAGNAMFAAVTGVGVAAAAAFSHIAYPPMRAAGYRRSFATGCIAGSSVLGLLIPPSVFMIVWGVLTEQSVGRLFAAGVLPGLLLTLFYMIYCISHALLQPAVAGGATPGRAEEIAPAEPGAMIGVLGIVLIVLVTLGGIWFGYFTPTEGSAVGVLGAVILFFVKGKGLDEMVRAIRDAGMVVTPIMILLVGASLYSKLLALGGVPDAVGALFQYMDLGPTGTIVVMALVWLVLGFFIDSISIMLLTVPLFWPIAQSLGIDPFAFAIFGILIIEAGVLTPPFGIGVFVVKAAVPDPNLTLGEVFAGVVPYWMLLLLVAVLVYIWPGLSGFLPSLL